MSVSRAPVPNSEFASPCRQSKTSSCSRAWADAQLDEREAQACARLQVALDRNGGLDATFADGELTLFAGGAAALDRIYLSGDAGRLAEAYWRWLILEKPRRNAAEFAKLLRRPPAGAVSAAATQFIDRVGALAAEVAAIADEERAMNERLYDLYALTAEERVLVEKDIAARR